MKAIAVTVPDILCVLRKDGVVNFCDMNEIFGPAFAGTACALPADVFAMSCTPFAVLQWYVLCMREAPDAATCRGAWPEHLSALLVGE